MANDFLLHPCSKISHNMDISLLKLNIEDEIGIITIDNPPLNSLTPSLINEFLALLNSLGEKMIKVVIITGSSRCFSAGVDLNEFKRINSASEALDLTIKGQDLLNRLESFQVPVLAAVTGVCLGGGAELALSCHVRYCADKAVFGFPELSLGIIPALGGTQRLPRTVGAGKALELILTGNIINAEEAEEAGLVEGIFPRKDLLEGVKKIARHISQKNPEALRYLIESVLSIGQKGLRRRLRRDAYLNSSLMKKTR